MVDHLRTCHLCEACCGLVVSTEGDQVVRVRGDRDDLVSRGHICPKGAALKWLHHDPDRVRVPLVRRGDDFEEVDWAEAFERTDRLLGGVVRDIGAGAIAIYYGNPAATSLALNLYAAPLMRLTRSRWSAGPVDTFPIQLATGSMFGGAFTIPVPDLDRTELLWIVGANPVVSNGSLVVAPDFGGRLAQIQERGGRVVVFDPRRTATTRLADEHVIVRPGADALFLAAVVHELKRCHLVDFGRLAPHVERAGELFNAVRAFSPEAVEASCGIPASSTRRLARELASAERAVVYGRVGSCTQEFGTLTSWLIVVLNAVTGNLDEPGGAMFAWPAIGSALTEPGRPLPPRRDRFRCRAGEHGELFGELPVGCLSEEITLPGSGRIRGLITLAGNPARSVPDPRLEAALKSLRAMVSLDVYVNETTRHAHVLLPGQANLAQPHMPMQLQSVMLQQHIKWSEAVISEPDRPADWEIALRLRAILQGRGCETDLEADDLDIFSDLVASAVQRETSAIFGRSVREIVEATDGSGPERIVDFRLRTGPYGDAYGGRPGGLTLAGVRDHEEGVVVGELTSRLPSMLRTVSGLIDLAPAEIIADVPRLQSRLDASAPLVLIGRRELRSLNSWMDNIPALTRGRARSRLEMNPLDASRLALTDGGRAIVSSQTGTITVEVEVTDDVPPGVVCLPHGQGHQAEKRLHVASSLPGASSNLLGDPGLLDVPSGTSVVNGLPVRVEPADSPDERSLL
jgi:anaerobic selenocysteine-containing dehydrogenase